MLPPDPLTESWMRGVAANPAAPPGVLLRLLDPAGSPAWDVLCEQRPLPVELVAAVLAHPDPRVRGAFARNGFADPADRGLLASDPDGRVRLGLALGPRRRSAQPVPLPDVALETLLLQDGVYGNALLNAGEFCLELFFSQQVPQRFLRGLLRHENPALRVHSARIWHWLSPEERQVLLADPDPVVQAGVEQATWWDTEVTPADLPEQDCHARTDRLVNCPLSRSVIEGCLASRRNLTTLAYNRHMSSDVVARLARDPDPDVRAQVAWRSDLDPALLDELARDPDPKVRERVAGYPGLDPVLLDELGRDTDEGVSARAQLRPQATTQSHRLSIAAAAPHRTADQIGPLDPSAGGVGADWLAACAVSAQPLMRRVAAINSVALPPELVDRLAHDQDPDVRHLLAYNHPAAPAELLLEAFVAGPRQRAFLVALPAFPRVGLGDLLDHADPEVRTLAVADTTLNEPPYGQLADADSRVRRAAAANPLLSPQRITALLDDLDLAEAAAANPALTAEQMHRLLDLAAIP